MDSKPETGRPTIHARWQHRAVIKRGVNEGVLIDGPCRVRVARNRDGNLVLVFDFDDPTEVRRVDNCGDVGDVVGVMG